MPNTVHQEPGSLWRKISIQKPVNVSDGAGGEQINWETVLTTFAQVKPTGGSEPYFASQLYPHTSYNVRIRYRKAVIIPGYRVAYGSHLMRIRSFTDTESEHAFIDMKCEELQAEGVLP